MTAIHEEDHLARNALKSTHQFHAADGSRAQPFRVGIRRQEITVALRGCFAVSGEEDHGDGVFGCAGFLDELVEGVENVLLGGLAIGQRDGFHHLVEGLAVLDLGIEEALRIPGGELGPFPLGDPIFTDADAQEQQGGGASRCSSQMISTDCDD